MTLVANLEGALCAEADAQTELWDPELHHHDRLGRGNSCWMCLEARDICLDCPVMELCHADAVNRRESFMIRAGMLWSVGRPRSVLRRS